MNETALDDHMRQAHNFNCPFCDESFASIQDLHEHNRVNRMKHRKGQNAGLNNQLNQIEEKATNCDPALSKHLMIDQLNLKESSEAFLEEFNELQRLFQSKDSAALDKTFDACKKRALMLRQSLDKIEEVCFICHKALTIND